MNPNIFTQYAMHILLNLVHDAAELDDAEVLVSLKHIFGSIYLHRFKTHK
ncbi:hypothetical protein MASR1M31_13040 [Porphyromonadaceae bacterium]